MRLLSQMNNGQACCLSAHSPTRGTRAVPLYVGYVSSGRVFSLIRSLPSSLSADVLSVFVRMIHRCRVGGGALARWPPSAAQTVHAGFPHTAFTKIRIEMPTKELTRLS